MMSLFFKTTVRRAFYEHVMPSLVRELGRVADQLAALHETLQRKPPGQQARLHVLLVDDEELVLRAMHRALKPRHDVIPIGTPEGAAELLDAHDFQAVITDHDLPGGRNGIWILEQARARRPEAYRILMSGQEPPGLQQHLDSGLVQRFLPKPVSTAEVLGCLREFQQ